MKRATLLMTCAALLLAGCAARSGPDYGPIGDGLKMIGVCAVLCALVGALAGLIDGDNDGEGGS